MKASELITRLQTIIELQGDLEVIKDSSVDIDTTMYTVVSDIELYDPKIYAPHEWEQAFLIIKHKAFMIISEEEK